MKSVQWTVFPPNKYAGLMPSEMKKLRELEDESEPMERQWSERHWRTRLKKIVAGLMLDKEMLQDVVKRKL